MDIEKLTNEIMHRLLEKIQSEQTENNASAKKMFLQSDGEAVSIPGYKPHDLENAKDINQLLEYEFLVLGKLTVDELASTANGQSINAKTSAVRQFLLTGKKVYIIENGLEHRAYKEVANPVYYNIFRNYEKQLVQFGVRIISPMALEKVYSKETVSNLSTDVKACQVCDSSKESLTINYSTKKKLVTLEMAVKMANETAVILKPGTIITPSAKDIFKEKNTDIKFV
ncbi:MAG: hypothetical protein MJA31_07675 [Clostridia bacterium]|nr:hypothetical protein [Clostridia bacterium]